MKKLDKYQAVKKLIYIITKKYDESEEAKIEEANYLFFFVFFMISSNSLVWYQKWVIFFWKMKIKKISFLYNN